MVVTIKPRFPIISFDKEEKWKENSEEDMKRLSGVQTGSLTSEEQARQGAWDMKSNFPGEIKPGTTGRVCTCIPTYARALARHTGPPTSASVPLPVPFQDPAGAQPLLTDPLQPRNEPFLF